MTKAVRSSMQVLDLASLIKQGLIARGTIGPQDELELSLVGDKVNVTIK